MTSKKPDIEYVRRQIKKSPLVSLLPVTVTLRQVVGVGPELAKLIFTRSNGPYETAEQMLAATLEANAAVEKAAMADVMAGEDITGKYQYALPPGMWLFQLNMPVFVGGDLSHMHLFQTAVSVVFSTSDIPSWYDIRSLRDWIRRALIEWEYPADWARQILPFVVEMIRLALKAYGLELPPDRGGTSFAQLPVPPPPPVAPQRRPVPSVPPEPETEPSAPTSSKTKRKELVGAGSKQHSNIGLQS